jgi:hypothetical protein
LYTSYKKPVVSVASVKAFVRRAHGLAVANRFGAYLHRGEYKVLTVAGEGYFPADEDINFREGLSVMVYVKLL